MMEMMVELLNKSKVYMMHDVNPVYLHQQPYVCFICEIIRQISFSRFILLAFSIRNTPFQYFVVYIIQEVRRACR